MAHAPVFSKASLLRQPSAIRALQPLVGLPGMISLGGGYPNPRTFPFERMSVALKDGRELTLEGGELAAALQYSNTPGLPRLHALLHELVVGEHAPPRGAEGTALAVAAGSQDAMTRTFEALLNRGDALLVEQPTYSGALAHLQPMELNLVGVATDADGIVPGRVHDALSGWERPRVLYTIPNGSNPTGMSMTLERKQELYAVAREWDLTILEDDPYYYLQFGEQRTPSLLSLDEDGRVVRFDSFSKILSSGLRVGFASGCPAVIERINLHAQSTLLHPCGLAQAVTLALMEEWRAGNEFEAHVARVVEFYRGQRDALLASADAHLTGLARWNAPTAGMFLWMELLAGVQDSFELITEKAVDAKVLFVPGTAFMPRGEPTPFVRASFSAATPEDMDEAMRRLGGLLQSSS